MAKVDTKHRLYTAMLARWERVRDCYEGGDAVKARGPRYLPLLDSHRTDTKDGQVRYEEYKLRALFYNAMARTVDGLAGAIFQKSPEIKATQEVQDQLKEITSDGMPFELFGLKCAQEVLIAGRYGVLLDMPAKDADLDEPGDTGNEEPTPYWCGYAAEDIVNWTLKGEGGDLYLGRVILREWTEKPDPENPEFGTILVERYRVLELEDGSGEYTVTLWEKEKPDSKEFTAGAPVKPERLGSPLTFIPFMFLGPTSMSPVPAKPPLVDLADVNLSHYRTSADLEHGRHFTALPTPWVSGLADSGTGQLSIGSGTAWVLQPNGSAGMLEFSGAGLGALVTADQDKRKAMATLGARLLEDQPVAVETATAFLGRHAGEHATLKTITQALERGLETVLKWHVWWQTTGVDRNPVEEDVAIEMNKDFLASRLGPQELQALVAALQAETISYATFYAELKRGGLARPGVEADEELAEIKRTGSSSPSGNDSDILPTDGNQDNPSLPNSVPGKPAGNQVPGNQGKPKSTNSVPGKPPVTS